MGRKENRRMMKLDRGTKYKKPKDMESLMQAFTREDGERVYPVMVDEPAETGITSPEGLMRMAHKVSDRELNRLIYQQAKDAVEGGVMADWPEDDFGLFMWFLRSFITPEMKTAFPEISKEYLAHEPMIKYGASFEDVPYPFMTELSWEDAYNFRILAIMLICARRGSSYSRNFLTSLYKVYHKREYGRLKRLSKLTFLDLLEIFDEDCKEKGYASGHTMDGEVSFAEQMIEKRRHEPGWTNVFGDRPLSPTPGMPRNDMEHAEDIGDAADYVRSLTDAPDEPPLQPVSSRLFVMCEMLGIPIDPTCNGEAYDMNEAQKSLLDLEFLGRGEFRRLKNDLLEHVRSWNISTYPEMADPFEYQTDKNYLSLQMAEEVLGDVLGTMGRNQRLPYESRKFSLADEVSRVAFILEMDFRDVTVTFDQVLILSMVHYLSECLCDVVSFSSTA